jgi:hypothetical protein
MHQEISQDDEHVTLDIWAMVRAARQRENNDRDLMRELLAALDRVAVGYRAIWSISHAVFGTVNGKQIDDRECSPFETSDADWGEQDDLSNVPRKADRCA